MTAQGWLQIVFYVGVLTLLAIPLGRYMARVYEGERVLLTRILGPLERGIYRLLGQSARVDQDWKAYARTTIVFSLLFWLALYALLRVQGSLPLNPEGFGAAPWDVTFNTTTSFVTNTNWQFYGGDTTMSYLSQMAGLAVQNFVSAAIGMAVLIAVVRGLRSRGSTSLGNFWQDLTRGLLYVLLPLSFLGALILVSQGVIQTFSGSVGVDTLTGTGGGQTLALGPTASQVAIKQLGTNGGGFFNVNSAFPFENPTALSGFVEMLFILLIPAALVFTFGSMVRSRRQAWAVYAAMAVLMVGGLAATYAAEQHGTPALDEAGIETAAADGSTGGNLEGKEQRNGIVASTEWAVVTTDASNGSVNSAHDAYSGIGGGVLLANMMTGEVIFGGVGSGLYGMFLFVLLTVFIAGLMVGRTPEYLGKKIEAREVKLVMIGVLVMPIIVLAFTALAIATDYGAPSIYNPGPQGFSETLYAFTSQANNNGSAFAGYTGFLQPNAPGNVGSYGITFANVVGGLALFAGRYPIMIAALAIAGSLAAKKVAPAGAGTFRTDTPTFVVLLLGVILIVGALTFFPALLLGPIVQGLTPTLF
jgi:potassium-transporting ATPase potassium-binding subunit